MSPTRYRVASSHPEETAKGATFAPGEEVRGLDPENEDDARKIDEGRFVEIAEQAPPKISDAAANKAAELGVDLEEGEGTGGNKTTKGAARPRNHQGNRAGPRPPGRSGGAGVRFRRRPPGPGADRPAGLLPDPCAVRGRL